MHTSNAWSIRPAATADAAQIAEFNRRMALETERKALDPDTVLRGVQRLLAEPGLGRYYVAEQDGRLLGQAMITYEWSDWRNGLFWWLQSVYVEPGSRSRGVFGSLCRHIETLADRQGGVCGLRLYVENGNEAAKAAYRSLGFASAGYEVLERLPGVRG